MATTAWLAGFAAFVLGIFHLSLRAAFGARFHQWLALGWLGNCIYIYFETQSIDTGQAQIPYYFSLTLLLFFVLATDELSVRDHRKSLALAMLALVFSIATYKLADAFLPSWVTFIGGSAFSAIVYLDLSRALFTLKLHEIGNIFLGPRARLLYPTSQNDLKSQRFLPVDAALRSLMTSAKEIAVIGKSVAAVSYGLFGLLQLLYPLREWLLSIDKTLWVMPFWVGMILKLGTGIGFVILIVSHTRLVEVLARRAKLSAELARITASVEHDIRGPIGELTTVIVNLDKKARDNHPKYGEFLAKNARYLEQIQARASVVIDMILAMREPEDEFEKGYHSFPVGNPMKKAIQSVRTLHDETTIVVNQEAFRPKLLVHGNDLRLVQVFRNILNNSIEAALEHKPDSRPVIKVKSSSDGDSGMVLVEIEDEAGGIDPKILPNISEAGVSSKHGPDEPNRGLGLYIAKRIIDMHHGKLTVESRNDVGATVKIYLPQA